MALASDDTDIDACFREADEWHHAVDEFRRGNLKPMMALIQQRREAEQAQMGARSSATKPQSVSRLSG